MANNNGKEVSEHMRYIKTSGHGQMTREQAKALKDKWNAKIHGASDNGDNASKSVTPP